MLQRSNYIGMKKKKLKKLTRSTIVLRFNVKKSSNIKKIVIRQMQYDFFNLSKSRAKSRSRAKISNNIFTIAIIEI